MADSATVAEYDAYFRADPNRWADGKRDTLAFSVLDNYLEYPPKTFLDVGCGNGHSVELFSKQWPGTECWGLDLSVIAIELAKKRVPEATFICASLEDAVLPKYDVIISLGVLEHFLNYTAMFAKLRSIMGGILYMEVPNCIAYPSSEHIEGFRRLNQGSRQVEWHLYRETWEKRIAEAGFTIERSVVGPSVYCEFIWLLK